MMPVIRFVRISVPFARIDGRLPVIKFRNPSMISGSLFIISGIPSSMPAVNSPRIFNPASRMLGKFSTMPVTIPNSKSPPAARSVGKFSSITAVIEPIKAGKLLEMPFATSPTSVIPAVSKPGTLPEMKEMPVLMISSPCVPITSPMESNTVEITGRILSAAVVTDDKRFPVNCAISALLFPIPVTQFSHAFFAEFTLPSIVVLASSAVVPVIPISVCTTWIASTMSE